jgi:hypothetical protein
MKLIQINTEHPNEHWQYIECEGAVTVDLGCGRHLKEPSWPTTPEWFLEKGATEVHAYDVDANEINWYNTTLVPNKNIKAYQKVIAEPQDILEIINTHNPSVIKCDIEGYESVLLQLSDEDFSKVSFYAIETHSNELFNSFLNKFNSLPYTITAIIDLLHAPPMKVIFAKKHE